MENNDRSNINDVNMNATNINKSNVKDTGISNAYTNDVNMNITSIKSRNMDDTDVGDGNADSVNMSGQNRKDFKNTIKDEKVVFEGNAFYEIDLKCVREKQREMSAYREQRQRGKI